MTNLHTKPAGIALLIALAAASASGASAASPAAAKSSCTVPNADARVVAMNQPDYPQIAWEQGLSGTAVVQIDLQANGSARNPIIFESTGNKWLDEAARTASLKQQYSPEVQKCSPLNGSYLVRVEFTR